MDTTLGRSAAQVLERGSPLSLLVGRPAVPVPVDSTLARVAALMDAEGVSAFLVEGGGIVTERDLARSLPHGVSPDAPVARISTDPVVVPGTTSVLDGCAVMLNRDLRHVVVDLGDAVGLVSLRDVAAVLLQAAEPHLWLTSLRVAVTHPAEIWLG